MNSRALVAASRAILAPRTSSITLARNGSAYKPPASWFPVTYNELPVPEGSWQKAYDAAQRKYNLHLAGGIGFFIFTLTVIKTSGLVEFNASIPPLPEE